MIKTNKIYIPIPKSRKTKCKVEINSQDMTARVIKSSFVYPCTGGIGTFFVMLSNAHGQLNEYFDTGQAVKFYADNSDGSTLQFWGIIDYVKNNISDNGQFLEIEGRHRAYLLNEYLVCYSATGTPTSTILKEIIDNLPESYGFTYKNVATTTDSMNVEWSYKPFWDCVVELCNFAGNDCYVDNSLDFHYFEENSIENTDDAIVEGDNFISSENWGTNVTYEKSRVTVIGQDDEGVPIIYTAKIDDETNIKEVFLRDSTANTEEKVQNIAESKLAELSNRAPQATIKSFGLEATNPGDNLWIIVPRQQIQGQYKIIQINHLFGAESGGWRTICTIEEQEIGISQSLKNISNKTTALSAPKNINKLNYSFNFSFDNDSGTHSGTEITEGVLKTTGGASGTWISPEKAVPDILDQFEFRAVGESIPGTSFFVSTDNGNTWQDVEKLKTLYDFSSSGQNLKIKVILNSASTQIKSLGVLYS